MKQKIILLLFAGVMICGEASAQRRGREIIPRSYPVAIIPVPSSITAHNSMLLLPHEISVSDGFSPREIQLLTATFGRKLGITLSSGEPGFIRYHKDPLLAKEQYTLTIDDGGITITSSGDSGRLWGVQSLRQLAECAAFYQQGEIKSLPWLEINDTPKYEWRGFHTDVSRHFFSKEYLKEVMERMSFYKLNKFHLHLTDDQGWRIEIERYPLLTEIGAYRTFNRYDSICMQQSIYNTDMRIDPAFITGNGLYGGFYTKSDIKELINYGLGLGIEIVPEVDMPGHLSAAMRAYPYLSCIGGEGWGREFSAPMCTANPRSMEFAKDVLEEIAELFPSEYIHIGADEVEKDNWEKCPACQNLIKELDMSGVEELQNKFVNEVSCFLQSKGKKVIAWDDAFVSGLSKPLIYTYWRDWISDAPSKILGDGAPLIWTSWDYFYLSSRPSDRLFKELYTFDPKEKYGITDPSVMKGWQACVWTETIPNHRNHQYHIYPSLMAFAELSWGTADDFEAFCLRLKPHYFIMDSEGIHYRVSYFEQ